MIRRDLPPRRNAPVFVLGCSRSGTTLLASLLMSAGGFAVYLRESYVFAMMAPKYGDLRDGRARRRLTRDFLASPLFARGALDAGELGPRLERCQDYGAFLRTHMDALAAKQGASRWLETTPEHLLDLASIKAALPDALVIHVLRDGRDVAVSLDKMGWVKTLPGDRARRLLASAAYWDFIVREGRARGRELGADYLEVRYDRLVQAPGEVLAEVGTFIDQELDHTRILANAVGVVGAPNTSFPDEIGGRFNPLGRFKQLLSPRDVAGVEVVAGELLSELGFPLVSTETERRARPDARVVRAVYPRYFALRQWLKAGTPLGRLLTDTSLLRQASVGGA